jgi:hypothetical protein
MPTKNAKQSRKSPRRARPTEAQPSFSPWQTRVLQLLALGTSINAAMRSVQRSESTFFKTCKRRPVFKEHADRARQYHRAEIDDLMHEVDADARALLHRIILDEELAPSIRLRAALAALNRKPGAWLPNVIPHVENVPDLGIFEMVHTMPQAEVSATCPESPRDLPGEADTAAPQQCKNVHETLDTLDTPSFPEELAELAETEALNAECDAFLNELEAALTLDMLDTSQTCLDHLSTVPPNAPQPPARGTGVPTLYNGKCHGSFTGPT